MHQNNISGINIFIMCIVACISKPFVNAQAYQISDIIGIENLDFPVNSNPAASDAFLDGKITATACQLGDYRSVPTPSLIASGTEYGIRKMNLSSGFIELKYVDTNGTNINNGVLYTLNNPRNLLLKSVSVKGGNAGGKWKLYGRYEGLGAFNPVRGNYGQEFGKGVQSNPGEESEISDEVLNKTYAYFCFVPATSGSTNFSYVKFTWEVDATDPELEYYGTIDGNGICSRKYGLTDYNLPELRNPLKLQVLYASSNPDVASVDALGNVTVHAMGQTIISATPKDTETYGPSMARYLLNVHPHTVSVSLTESPGVSLQLDDDYMSYIINFPNAEANDIAKIKPEAQGEGVSIWYRFITAVDASEDIEKVGVSTIPAAALRHYKKYEGTPIEVSQKEKGTLRIFSEAAGARSEAVNIFNDIMTSVAPIIESQSESEEYYTLQGIRLEHPGHGIFLVRRAGKWCKIIM